MSTDMQLTRRAVRPLGRVEKLQMKRNRRIGCVLASVGFGLLVATTTLAANGQGPDGSGPPGQDEEQRQPGWDDGRHHNDGPGLGVGHHTEPRGRSGNVPPGHLPELDPGVAVSAVVLLIGGTLVLRGRRRSGPKA